MIPISKAQSAYIREHSDSDPCISTTSRDKPKGKRKKRNIPETPQNKALLKKYYDEEIVILEKHGYFEEEYRDKNGKLRTHTVYYK